MPPGALHTNQRVSGEWQVLLNDRVSLAANYGSLLTVVAILGLSVFTP